VLSLFIIKENSKKNIATDETILMIKVVLYLFHESPETTNAQPNRKMTGI
jgi:hypothetical protein